MSVQELRARILKFDSEIERQMELLKTLEQDKSIVQSQLNAVLDPVARLPLEISSEIFLQFFVLCETRPVPTVLLNICRAWAVIAKSTAALWTAVHIDFPCGDDLAQVLPIWFQRAQNYPLSITISLRGRFSSWNHHVSSVIWKHGEKFKHLEILHDDDFADTELDETVDLFGESDEDTNWLSLPLLETLTIRCQHRQRMYFASQIFELIRQAPNIVELSFGKIALDFDGDSDADSDEKLLAPTLRRLVFEDDYTDDSFLNFVSLPALNALCLPVYYVTGENLLAFLERSGAPLRDLALGGYHPHSSVPLHECLRGIPTLTRFRMSEANPRAVTDLFVALADSPSMLPNLCNLTIRTMGDSASDIPDSSWRALVRALSTRRMQSRIVGVAVSPPEDVLASFRELAVDGADIYVGTEECNFVVAQ
ncbi:hypothetical protein MSAN_01183500 [Mycena sanguinolenta]|uniref:F-box domain-containing protein n=1 Tax=Mycena sanguinolenta TaxID=230812 RepID=A0A8H6YHZ3_9AGAR|nr:hypothetical protein MSAN_01183500 [Mycena sanguinolenta]